MSDELTSLGNEIFVLFVCFGIPGIVWTLWELYKERKKTTTKQ